MHSALAVTFGITWQGVVLRDCELSWSSVTRNLMFSLADGVCSLAPLSGGLDSCSTSEWSRSSSHILVWGDSTNSFYQPSPSSQCVDWSFRQSRTTISRWLLPWNVCSATLLFPKLLKNYATASYTQYTWECQSRAPVRHANVQKSYQRP